MEGRQVVGGLGSRYILSAPANGERRRATCGWEFKIKGGWILQKPKGPHRDMAH